MATQEEADKAREVVEEASKGDEGAQKDLNRLSRGATTVKHAHRVRACEELGIEDWPSIIRSGLTEDEKRAHARKLNLVRRQLSQKQKR